MDVPGKQIAGRDASQSKNGTASGGDTRADNRTRRKPNLVFENDRLDQEVEANAAPIVTAGAEIRTLGQAAMIAAQNLSQIVQPDILPDPTMIADFKSPGKLDADAGFDRYAATYAGAEQLQDNDAQA